MSPQGPEHLGVSAPHGPDPGAESGDLAAGTGGGDEVFRAGRARLRHAALRHVDAVRRDRHSIFAQMAEVIDGGSADRTILAFALVFIVAGLGFKLSASVHMWGAGRCNHCGAPTAVTLFIGSAPKLAASAFALCDCW